MKNQTAAPALYRPGSMPTAQPKMANGTMNRRPPVAPAPYRPQPAPKVLQTKSSLIQRPQPEQAPRRPVAPPVYRPEQKKIVQSKVFSQRRIRATAPPVYRPGKLSIAQPKLAPATQAQWKPTTPTVQRAQAQPVTAGMRTPAAQPNCVQPKAHQLGHATSYSATRLSSTIQRMIGPDGALNVGKMIVGTDRTIATITGAQRAGYMPGAKPPEIRPWLYRVQFHNGRKSGFVIESDPNWWLVPVGQESEHRKQEKEIGWLIPLRSTELQAAETGLDYDIKLGKMYDKKGGLLNFAGKLSFVITAEGRLLIGFLHTGLSKAASTMMAGELTIKNGVAEYDWRRSGHYLTTQPEQARGFEYMRKYYPWIVINQMNVDEQDRPKTLAELFKADPVDESISFLQKPLRTARPKASVGPSVSGAVLHVPSGLSSSSSSSSSADARRGMPSVSFGPSLNPSSLSSVPRLPAASLLDLSGLDLPDFSRMSSLSSGPSRRPGLSLPSGSLLDLSGLDLPDFSGVSSLSSEPRRRSGARRRSGPSLPSAPLDLSGVRLPDFSSVSSPRPGSALDDLRSVPLRPKKTLAQIFENERVDMNVSFELRPPVRKQPPKGPGKL